MAKKPFLTAMTAASLAACNPPPAPENGNPPTDTLPIAPETAHLTPSTHIGRAVACSRLAAAAGERQV